MREEMVSAIATSKPEQKLIVDQRLVSVALLCLVVALGGGLRFYDLGAHSYWVDEVKMVRLSAGSLEDIFADSRDNGRPPVFVLLAHVWIGAFGTSEASTRSLTASVGAASLVVIYLVGRRLLGRQVALLGTFLMAVSQFHIYNSQEFRYYSLFVLLTLLSFLFYLDALQSGKKRYFALYALSSVLSFYTHTFALFTVMAQVAHFVLHWRRYERVRGVWFGSQAPILAAVFQVLLLPMIQPLLEVARATPDAAVFLPGPNHIAAPPPLAPLYTLFGYVIPTATRPNFALLMVELGVFAAVVLLYNASKGRDKLLEVVYGLATEIRNVSRKKSALLLCGLWLGTPIGVAFIVSETLKPIYVDRYLSAASPAFYLLLAFAITRVGKAVPQLLSVALLAVMIAPGLQQYYVSNINDQWRDVAAYIEEHSRSGDTIVFAPDNVEGDRLNALNWYYRGSLPECQLMLSLSSDQAIARALAGCVSGHDRFWLILHDWPGAGYVPLFTSFFLDRDLEEMRIVEGRNFTWYKVYLFAVTGDADSR